MSEEINTNDGLTRREALKKGARLGGALVWAVPVVQTVGMSPALAQTVSERNCCLEVEITDLEVGDFDGQADGVDVRVRFRGVNCGSTTIYDVQLVLEVKVGDGPWGNAATVGGSETFDVIPGSATTTFTVIEEALSGETYFFRLAGSKQCLDDETGDRFGHDIPLPYDTASIAIP